MKIIRFEAENFKRLRAVSIAPDADNNLVIVSGKNGAGKSSTLDAIWGALGGGTAAKETSRPIRDGETEAHVELDMGELIVTRTWTADGKTSLVVKASDGARYQSPQSLLDALVGRLSFDPLAFAGQSPKDQRATLTALVKLPFDPDELDRERELLYAKRTDVGRELKQLQGQLAGIPEITDELPPNEVSLADLTQRFQEALDRKRTNESVRDELKDIAYALQVAESDIERLTSELADAEKSEANHRHDLNFKTAEVEALIDPDLDALDARIRTVESTNVKVRQVAERQRVSDEVSGVIVAQANLTEQINAIDERKSKAVAEAKMPIDGLGFDSDGVTYQGVPFKQASSAEQLRVSVAMAMALNPKVRVIRISDGSLLDSDNLALIEQMADANDFQCWIEVVDESGDLGVVIEDGLVREPVTV